MHRTDVDPIGDTGQALGHGGGKWQPPPTFGTQMMIEPIKLACSEQFTRALRALDDGHDVRLSSWPPGVYLRKQDKQVAMYHNERLSSPSWSGPSTEEASAFDWIVIQNQHSA